MIQLFHQMYGQDSDEMDVDSDDGASPPPPPPPPIPPQITSLTVERPFCLPNGVEIPAGTKQVIVHPYSDSHPYAEHFTSESIHASLNAAFEPEKNGIQSETD